MALFDRVNATTSQLLNQSLERSRALGRAAQDRARTQSASQNALYGTMFGSQLAEGFLRGAGLDPQYNKAVEAEQQKAALEKQLSGIDYTDPQQLRQASKLLSAYDPKIASSFAQQAQAIETAQQAGARDEEKRFALAELLKDPKNTQAAQTAVRFGADPETVNKLRGTQLKSMSKYGKMAEDLGFAPGTPAYKAKVEELMLDNPDAIKIINEPPDAFVTEFGKKEAKRLSEQGAKARTAVKSLTALSDSIELLNNNEIISGIGGNFKLNLSKALSELGLIGSESVEATEAFFSNQGNQVAQVIKEFGAGTGLSDADREYAQKIAGGEISLTRDSLAKLLNLQRKYQRMGIEQYNNELEGLDSEQIRQFAQPLDIPKVPIAVPSGTRTGVTEDGRKVYEINGEVVDIYGEPVR